MVVDDQESTGEILGEIVEDILKGKGCRVVLADGGYAAIKKIKEIPFTIVFLDINMPDMNGVKTLRQIKRISPGTVVVMTTAGAEGQLVRASTKEGAYAILYKPFDYHRIMQIVNEVLNGKNHLHQTPP